MVPTCQILVGDCREVLKTLPDESVHCVVTSPPYYGLRDYGTGTWEGGDPACDHRPSSGGQGTSGQRADRTFTGAIPQKGTCSRCGAHRIDHQIGLESDFRDFIATMVGVFREVRRVLRSDGTCWINMGDSYATGAGMVGQHPGGGEQGANYKGLRSGHPGKHGYLESVGPTTQPNRMPQNGLKPKDLMGIPWRLALALQDDGWFLRSDIIWHKPNPMPESVNDRPTKSHEYLFLLTKSEKYFYDAAAIKEPASPETHARYARGRSNHHKWADGGPGGQTIAKSFEHMIKGAIPAPDLFGFEAPPPSSPYKTPDGWDTGNGSHGTIHQHGREKGKTGYQHKPRKPGVTPKSTQAGPATKNNESFSAAVVDVVESRNKRTVWTVPTFAYPDAHFATYPPQLITPCILAGCPAGGTVLDPFGGSGTTGQVALELHRSAILIELNPKYAEMIRQRTSTTLGLPL